MSDLLKRAKSVAKKAESKSKKAEIRQIVIESKDIASLIEIASLTGELKPLEDQRKTIVQKKLFDIWTEEMWSNKKKPENFKAVIKKENGLTDGSCNFILKVSKSGISNQVPKEEDLPDDKTVQEVLIEIISKQCDLTQENAKKFVNEEVEIKDKITLSDSFDEMFYGDNEIKNKIANLLLKYIQTRSRSKTKKVSLEEFTDEMESEALTTVQIVSLKGGMENRVFTYCDTLDQLRKLLDFCRVTKQVSNFEFAIGDDMKTKHERHKAVVDKYLDIKSEE